MKIEKIKEKVTDNFFKFLFIFDVECKNHCHNFMNATQAYCQCYEENLPSLSLK